MKILSILLLITSFSILAAGPQFGVGIYKSTNEDNNRQCPKLEITYDGDYATFGSDGIEYILYHHFYAAEDECSGYSECYIATPTGDSFKSFEIYINKSGEIDRLEFSKNNSNVYDDRNCVNFKKVN